ncbi:MAG: hypothetical protein DPW16_14185 [Chloroflexi bacterium]|nr:hypothetical protein [Chloroflexota bacterium]
MSYPANNSEQYPFFFYGTLRHSQENYVFLRGRTVYEQSASAQGMTLFSMRSYPVMTTGSKAVRGELMIIHPRFYYDMLGELDRMEGFNPHQPEDCLFRRELITVETEAGALISAWAYMGNDEMVKRLTLEEVPDGDWDLFLLRQMKGTRLEKFLPPGKLEAAEKVAQRKEKERSNGMPQSSIFRWREGEGWLVLAGGGDARTPDAVEILSEVLARTLSEGPLAYIWAASDVEEADNFLAWVGELGGRTGYLMDVAAEDPEFVMQQLSEAGIIILGDGPNVESLRSALTGAAMAGIRQAYASGATILGIGAGAAMMGYAILDGLESQRGFNWLEQALVLPNYDEQQAELMHRFLAEYPDTYGLGLTQGSAVAFLPTGAVEVWGNKRIVVSLGKGMTRSGE